MARIASLLPSATEIVCLLEGQADLVGVSHECDFPLGVESLPVLTRARLAPLRSSGEIDRQLREILSDALAVYEIDVERLERARPDVIVTQDLCEVCAVSFDDVCSAVSQLANKDVQIVSLHPTRLDEIWADIERVGAALGKPAIATRVLGAMKERVASIAARATQASRVSCAPKVLSIEWIAPVMIGGMWMPELIELAGGTALVTKAGEHAPTLALDALRALDPDVVLVKPCGFSLARTLEELTVLRDALPWQSWRAVREGRVYVADGNAYFNRSGPRIVESLEILAGCTHPELFADFRLAHSSSVVRLDAQLSLHPF